MNEGELILRWLVPVHSQASIRDAEMSGLLYTEKHDTEGNFSVYWSFAYFFSCSANPPVRRLKERTNSLYLCYGVFK